MESARDKRTGEIVEAEDLWLLDSVDTEGYVCWGCGITMYPAAWEKDKKVRAYFKKKRHIHHRHECDADAESTVIRQGQKASVRNILDSAPGLMPSGLKLIEKRPVVEPGFSGDESKSSSTRSASSRSGEGNSPERQSRRQVNAIRNICRAFIRFPHDRGMSLNVPGISGQIYMTAFKKLRNEVQPYPEPKIFMHHCSGINLLKMMKTSSFHYLVNGVRISQVNLNPPEATRYTSIGLAGQKPSVPWFAKIWRPPGQRR